MKKQTMVTVDRNPEHLTTERVQFWSASGTMMGLISLAQARTMLGYGTYGVSTEQAIFEVPQNSNAIKYV